MNKRNWLVAALFVSFYSLSNAAYASPEPILEKIHNGTYVGKIDRGDGVQAEAAVMQVSKKVDGVYITMRPSAAVNNNKTREEWVIDGADLKYTSFDSTGKIIKTANAQITPEKVFSALQATFVTSCKETTCPAALPAWTFTVTDGDLLFSSWEALVPSDPEAPTQFTKQSEGKLSAQRN